ncbi:SprT family zinc-dependent metalloprotease [Leucobacter viscericola]|uniref:SprT family zinc-dependent metalloprotease n=1 Tax=Leucobacter viscericola TaxID=2714935 RepID=A0A6G7XID0_9MICO|nr:SprT-like domain-containing protein [Leucobacter viscericola]QIK64199.1 SprT family zinc-dependent metalloprotease [Leucobacter viscericola]
MADPARVRVWADALIRMHLDPEQWSFGFDNAKRRAGLCNFTDRKITVSRYLSEKFEDDEIHQVLLHEVAHAIAGPDAAHGPVWKRTAEQLGYVGGRTHDGEIAHERAPWKGTCPAGHEHFRFRKPTRITSCAKCSRGFSRSHLIVWHKR